jgi:peptidoglycan hydrolase-like protein with peptidoglycan-binding domain
VSQAVHLRRIAALCVALSLGVSAPAMAQTGGAEAQPVAQSAPAKPKRPTTKQIQRALGIKADGVFGPKTKRALKNFQRRNGIRVTGKINDKTLRALGLLVPPQNSKLDAVAIPADVKAILDQIAECESSGNLAAESRDGRYFGKYQFSLATWESLGGVGNPADADEATQDALAYKLYQQRGTAPWPSCSEKLDD